MAETLPIRKSKSIFDEIERMQDHIMRHAYDIFRWNGGIVGRDLDDWLEAEKQIKKRIKA